ncbi:MAG: UTP--glucose-1-phosphate uridylyltransferase [Armatimonadetes bacterium]|nr:UTP--glucose-1-phosphate uridylyltransferase [Armatimonadota bacterium]
MKGLILAAGYGTRFLPITKTVPKELLPLGTRPALDYIVQEFLDSGVRQILIVSSRRKRALEDYFDREIELEGSLSRPAHQAAIRPPDAEIFFVRQQRMEGTGAAVLLAREFVGNDPCVVAFPDDLHFGSPPLTRQLWDLYDQTGDAVVALERRPEGEDISRYGIADVEPADAGWKIRGLIEKPPRGTEPSRFISIGRYVLTPAVFDALVSLRRAHPGGEFFLTGALNQTATAGGLRGCEYRGVRLDTGEPDGYYRAVTQFWLQDPQYGPGFREYLQALLAEGHG